MKIFNRGDKAKAEAPAPKPEQAPAPAAEAPAAPPAPPAPDLTAIIDANVKEMSEKIARLASTIESEHSERSDFEAKLEKMEDRMRKLSSLTEMISAQYNPFVGSAPTEREAMPVPEVGLAAPAVAVPVATVAAAPPENPPALAISLDDAHASLAPALAELPPPEPEPAAAQLPPMEAPALAPPPAAEPDDGPARLWSVPPGFASSLLVLNWADMLLKSAPTRDALADILGYYQNIGWLGDPARDQLLAYADGLAFQPSGAEGRDWRANVDLHEKSLLYVEKLRALSGGSRGD